MTSESRRTPDENVLGTVIGHYKVTAVLNQGGMGAVYRAEHPLIGKPAVIKLLLPELSSDAEMVHRFFNEAKASSAIRHPGIVEIFDFGYHTDGRAYIVMEFLDGESLAERLAERGRLPELEVAAIGRSIAGALAAAHAKSIVHRDLKPDNIFLVRDPDMPTGERTKVLDFGIAKLSNDQPTEMSRTRTGAMMGTPLYMAPEQARGAGEVDARADLYALGCMLYEMLCGDPPFLAEGAGEIIAMQLFAEPVPPREIVPELSMEIDSIVLSLLEKDPRNRPQHAKEIADALASAMPRLSSRLSAVVPVPPQTKMRAVVTPRPVAAKMSGPRPTAAEPRPSAQQAEAPVPTIDPAAAPSLTPRSLAARAEPKPTTLGGSAAHVIPTLPPERRPRGNAGWIVAGGLAIAAAVAAFVIVKRMRADDGAADTKPTAATTPAPKPAPQPPAQTQPPPAPAAPTTMTLSLSLDPPDASVTIDGEAAVLTGGSTQLPLDGRDHALVVSAPGHLTRDLNVKADRDRDLSISLAEAAAPTPTPPIATAPPSHPPHLGRVRPPARPAKPTGATAGSGSAHDTKPTTSPNGSPIETTL